MQSREQHFADPSIAIRSPWQRLCLRQHYSGRSFLQPPLKGKRQEEATAKMLLEIRETLPSGTSLNQPDSLYPMDYKLRAQREKLASYKTEQKDI